MIRIVSFDDDIDILLNVVGRHFICHRIKLYVVEFRLEIMLLKFGRFIFDICFGLIVKDSKDLRLDNIYSGL